MPTIERIQRGDFYDGWENLGEYIAASPTTDEVRFLDSAAHQLPLLGGRS